MAGRPALRAQATMSNILFLYNNLLDLAMLTESSEASGFPAENVQHPFRTKVWQTAGGTPGTANLVIDHGSAKAVDCIALTGYDWASAPGTLDLEFNATDSWESPAATEALTWAATPTANGNKAVIIKKFTSKSYRYNRLNVVYSPDDWDLGRIFLGTCFEPVRNYGYGRKEDLTDPSKILRTIGGQEYVDEIEMYRSQSVKFRVITQAQWELFQKMINHAGTRKDLFVAFDYDNEPDELTVYGKFTKLPGMTRPFLNLFDFSLNFQESR